MKETNVALIGLAVMGSNLARNIERNGFPVVVYNRSQEVAQDFVQQQKGKQFLLAQTLAEVVQKTSSPRQVILMIKAGAAVDAVVSELLPLLSPGDIILDGGNSEYQDTMRRTEECRKTQIHFLGVGISGGEEGALNGPSIMPGGAAEAWEVVAPMLKKISAQVDGEPCCSYIGPNGAGHFVKMVHNGIEYGDMQLIAESYHLLSDVGRLGPEKLSEIFAQWNRGPLRSFLIEITADIFRKRDGDTGDFLVNRVLDKAGQKGTGRWTVEAALELGVPIPTIESAVIARTLSSLKEQRMKAAELLCDGFGVGQQTTVERDPFIADVHGALWAAKLIAYAQGMALLQQASVEYGWDLKLGEIAKLWRGGCIIRADFLNEITTAYEHSDIANLMLSEHFRPVLEESVPRLRRVVSLSSERGVPALGFQSALSYFDSYRSKMLPQNLTQAQRDYFGAHTFERTDRPGVFHADWQES